LRHKTGARYICNNEIVLFFIVVACSITRSNTTCLIVIFTITEFRTITLIVAPEIVLVVVVVMVVVVVVVVVEVVVVVVEVVVVSYNHGHRILKLQVNMVDITIQTIQIKYDNHIAKSDVKNCNCHSLVQWPQCQDVFY
jgi:hypothetical protein